MLKWGKFLPVIIGEYFHFMISFLPTQSYNYRDLNNVY